jgi:hypothetical protein
MQLSKNVIFDDNFKRTTGLDGFLKLPMSNESVVIPDDLVQALVSLLSGFKGVGKTDLKLIDSFI